MTVEDVLTVIKVGGSVLQGPEAYRAVARLLAKRLARGPTWVVVSAAKGITDTLDRFCVEPDSVEVERLRERQERLSGVPTDAVLREELRDSCRDSTRRARHRWLAWGERASTAALRTLLARLGVDVPIVELHAAIRLPKVRSALVPGFYLRDRAGDIRCLPRGGSDITAVLVAAALGSPRVNLWKDGGGIRAGPRGVVSEADGAALLPWLTGTIRPLHPAALRLAIRRGIDLILEDPFEHHAPTHVIAQAPIPASVPTSREVGTPAFDHVAPLVGHGIGSSE